MSLQTAVDAGGFTGGGAAGGMGAAGFRQRTDGEPAQVEGHRHADQTSPRNRLMSPFSLSYLVGSSDQLALSSECRWVRVKAKTKDKRRRAQVKTSVWLRVPPPTNDGNVDSGGGGKGSGPKSGRSNQVRDDVGDVTSASAAAAAASSSSSSSSSSSAAGAKAVARSAFDEETEEEKQRAHEGKVREGEGKIGDIGGSEELPPYESGVLVGTVGYGEGYSLCVDDR